MFRFLGVAALLGRAHIAERDAKPGAPRVFVSGLINGGSSASILDPSILGKTYVLIWHADRRGYGIMPPRFTKQGAGPVEWSGRWDRSDPQAARDYWNFRGRN
jgi:hypothetical protein